jgi:hypothetical protein
MSSDQKGVLTAMFAVLASFAASLGLGFLLRHLYPTLSDRLLGVIVVCDWAAMAFGILFFLSPWQRPRRRRINRAFARDAKRRTETFAEQKRKRIAELTADPHKHQYIPLMERGEWWTNEQIAYREDPRATATCVHLRKIEQAMRAAGVVPRLLTESSDREFAPLPNVTADCRVNEAELKRQFTLAKSVQYTSGYLAERNQWDNPWAELACTACQSSIQLVHHEWPWPTTIWFPAEPA